MSILALPDRVSALGLLQGLTDRAPTVGPRRVDKPLILYGAGNLGRLAAELLALLGIPVAYAIDCSPPADGLLLGRIPVIRPEEAPAGHYESHQVAVCVVLAPYTPILEYLNAMGWSHIAPFYDVAEAYANAVPMGNGWFAGELGRPDSDAIASVLQAWDDDISRAAHLQFLAWRLHREEWIFDGAPVNTQDRYFPDLIRSRLGENEVFLDAGAYLGDVVLRFDEISGGRFSEIIAVEADPANNTALRQRLADFTRRHPQKGLRIFDCALGRENRSAAFCSELGMGSRLFAGGRETVETRCLDNLYLSFSFAKLHLEGGELDALAGGIESLRRNRPMLAVTTYHNRDGLHAIPWLLMTHLEAYRFFLRTHAWCGTGVVLYAIPEERMHLTQRQS